MARTLIPSADYKNTILREIISDISNYILDNIAVKSMTFALVENKKGGLDATIPVKSINVDAKFDCNLSKSYFFHIEDTEKRNTSNDYLWIKAFPAICAAIDHNAKTMENIVTSSVDLSFNIGIGDKIKGKVGANLNSKFYINYVSK